MKRSDHFEMGAFYEWQIEKYLLIGKGWRVWFLVFPNDRVTIRWVPFRRFEGDQTTTDIVHKDTARFIWRMLVRCGGYMRVK